MISIGGIGRLVQGEKEYEEYKEDEECRECYIGIAFLAVLGARSSVG
jgi:hypothetical protein